ncbi:[FeFe] hydrogenase H-cluster maturation GTPase HydF [Brockia lithotrophica]|uniref:Iron-only hydrogenase maturation protein HydF n=1 Tax=Brockia lithotrophica TaxID=933949 RepID=A0A660L3G3_9BACL|nr:[FeFe] hydrogenase H-cluster maturation GTPase HydF [Brockia lithotrophica]RKQ88446.1 iron-only hydrogenase maturation protein HydF [Brockia lithotrophica]
MTWSSTSAAPRGERPHITLFGRRNAGKSQLLNAITGQNLAIVSPVAGTTTDPVLKAMELHPLGPVVLIDTAGIDDDGGELGALRVRKSLDMLARTDLALLVVDAAQGWGEPEERLLDLFRRRGTAYVLVVNKADILTPAEREELARRLPSAPTFVSAERGEGVNELLRQIVDTLPGDWALPTIVGDLFDPGDLLVMVTHHDAGAPKARLILPEQEVLRDIIDHGGLALVVEDRDLPLVFARGIRPRLVITDSSVFGPVAQIVPEEIPLTSFSVLFARYKGDLETLVRGVRELPRVAPGDRVLIAEACTHPTTEDDIARVKIGGWLRRRTGDQVHIDYHQGAGPLPEPLAGYRLIIHCGACMLNRREMLSRIVQAREAGVPLVNYGVALAYMQGVLRRGLSPFSELQALLDEVPSEGEEAKDPRSAKPASGRGSP